ncbi:uncharacterized [Tachysurus ichikawai]
MFFPDRVVFSTQFEDRVRACGVRCQAEFNLRMMYRSFPVSSSASSFSCGILACAGILARDQDSERMCSAHFMDKHRNRERINTPYKRAFLRSVGLGVSCHLHILPLHRSSHIVFPENMIHVGQKNWSDQSPR